LFRRTSWGSGLPHRLQLPWQPQKQFKRTKLWWTHILRPTQWNITDNRPTKPISGDKRTFWTQHLYWKPLYLPPFFSFHSRFKCGFQDKEEKNVPSRHVQNVLTSHVKKKTNE
jgi:hypothetical protein